jgi:hypothetical protein
MARVAGEAAFAVKARRSPDATIVPERDYVKLARARKLRVGCGGCLSFDLIIVYGTSVGQPIVGIDCCAGGTIEFIRPDHSEAWDGWS